MSSKDIPKVNTISQQVYSILKKDIVSGFYKPGDWLQETDLANRLQVSRSPIREALRQLKADGLVIEQPNKGSFVRVFTTQEMIEIFEVREMLESYAILHLDRELEKEEIDKLNSYREEFIRFHEENDLDSYTDTDSRFHRNLIRLIKNSILLDLYQKVRNMNRLFRIMSLSTKERFDESCVEHVGMIDLIKEGKLTEAKQINHTHLSKAKDTAIAHIKKKENAD